MQIEIIERLCLINPSSSHFTLYHRLAELQFMQLLIYAAPSTAHLTN